MRKWFRSNPARTGRLLARLASLINATVRYRDVDAPSDELLAKGAIISGWHGRSFPAAYRYRKRGWWVMVSQSRDGEIQNHVFSTLGFQVIRGSTKRGGAQAAVEGIRVLKAGGVMPLTPDGPRGPSGEVQGGILLMAQKSGVPIIPVGISTTPRILVKSWDRYMLPLPFAKGAFVYGKPIYIPREATPEEVEQIRKDLAVEMDRVENEAEKLLGRPPLSHTERHG